MTQNWQKWLDEEFEEELPKVQKIKRKKPVEYAKDENEKKVEILKKTK